MTTPRNACQRCAWRKKSGFCEWRQAFVARKQMAREGESCSVFNPKRGQLVEINELGGKNE